MNWIMNLATWIYSVVVELVARRNGKHLHAIKLIVKGPKGYEELKINLIW